MQMFRTTLASAVALALTAGVHAAAPENPDSLRAQVAKSDLVFVGNVIDVAYAPSADSGVPHTFVTYEVERVLQGEAADKTVTLRFLGGRGEEASFTMVPGLPMFDKGDRDVLMVAQNGASACPLVGCSAGRYRLINDLVFSEEGQAVERKGDDGIALRGFYKLEDVMTHHVSQTTMYLVDELPEGEGRVELDADRSQGAQFGAGQFIEHTAQAARDVGRATPGTFRSADIKAAFNLPFVPVAAPVDRAASAAQSTARTALERAEEAALRANGGNPVLGERPALKD